MYSDLLYDKGIVLCIRRHTFVSAICAVLCCLFALGWLGGVIRLAYADSSDSSDIATDILVNDTNIQDGDIVTFSTQGYKLSRMEYDPYAVGVLVFHPDITIVNAAAQKMYPLMRSGTARVRVSARNGAIAKGDLIASSTTPGVGIKATKAGYVIGAALEAYHPANKQAVGEISLTLDAHYIAAKATLQNSFADIFNLSKIATYDEPTLVIRYLLVGIIVIASLAAGFYVFERKVTKGIDTLGRNPLASHTIQIGMAINILITIAITFGGLFIAYLVLRL